MQFQISDGVAEAYRYAQRTVPRVTSIAVSALGFAGYVVDRQAPFEGLLLAIGGYAGAQGAVMAYAAGREYLADFLNAPTSKFEDAPGWGWKLWGDYCAFKMAMLGGVMGFAVIVTGEHIDHPDRDVFLNPPAQSQIRMGRSEYVIPNVGIRKLTLG